VRRVLLILGLGVAALLAAGAAHAGWSSQASGAGNAGARSLPAGEPPTVSVVGSAVTVSWNQVTFAGAPLGTYSAGGYIVRRYADASATAIMPGAGCSGVISGTEPAIGCTESGVPAGTWHYTVTPALGNWRGDESAQSAAPPVNVLTLANQTGGGSYLAGGTLYYRGSASGGGSFSIRNALVTSETDPASSEFAALAGTTTGWTHTTPDLQTTPVDGPYVSNAFSWSSGTTSSPTENITGRDEAGNATTTTLTFVNDSTGPNGGALTVNGTTGTGGGNSSLNNTGGWPVDSRTDYSGDAGSGLVSSILTVRHAPWSGATCGTFGAATTISGQPAQSASSGDGCYQYTLTGTDNVGNTSNRITTVRVDQTAPVTTDNTASLGGAWHNTTQTVTLTPTDVPGSGVDTTYYTTDGSIPTTSSPKGTSISLSATGLYTIRYFSVDVAGNAEPVKTASTQILIDKVLPANSVSLDSASAAYLSGSTLYFNRNTGGSFRLVDAVTDSHSGPASATFPGVTTTGWTGHTASETVSTGTGSAPTITYMSGTYTFAISAGTPGSATITSRDVAGNVSSGSGLTFTPDTSATAPTLAFPTAASSYNDAVWNSGCVSAICGTAADGGSGVQRVEVSIRQGAGVYWDGAGFLSVTPVWNLATGTSGWSLPFAASNYPAEGSYTVSVRVTDRVGNVSSVTSATFTIDRSAPTATNAVLANGGTLGIADKGDTVTVTYSEGMDAASFCSGWVNNGSNQTKSGSGGGVVVTIADGGTSDTLSSVTASGCTFHFGSVALNADYVSSTSTFTANGANASAITWNPTSRTLTITLGAVATGGQNSSVPSSTPNYSPDAVLKDLAGNAIAAGPFGGTLSRL
jgi:hypothetical protein